MTENFNKNRYNAKKRYYRFKIGIEQFLNYPYLNLIWILVIAVILFLINVKENFVYSINMPTLLMPITNICLKCLIAIIPIILSISIIQCLGELIARKDEADLMVVFNKNEQTYNFPILIHKKRFKNGVTIREFYTKIPMRTWQEQKENIADVMNVRFVSDFEYVNNNGNKIRMKTVKGRKAKNRGVLYDDTF